MEKKRVGIILIIICIMFVVLKLLDHREVVYKVYDEPFNAEIIADLCKQVIVEQVIYTPVENIKAIQINIPTFEREQMDGQTNIKVLKDNLVIGDNTVNTESLHDGEYIRVNLSENIPSANQKIFIRISSTSTLYKGIGVWGCSPKSGLLYDQLLINGQSVGTEIIPIEFICDDIRWSKWELFVLYLLLIYLFSIIYKNNSSDNSFFKVRLILLLFGIVIICLRGGVFSYSSLYAEDGLYLSNIINRGFIKSALMTRSGKANDFCNLGSYILLGISFLINRIFCGYNLINFPMIMGIVSSVFYSAISVYCFEVFCKKNKFVALLAYAICIFMPVNDSGMEIYGRVGNLVFIFPVLSVLILFNRWDKRYKISLGCVGMGIMLLICGLTFPISFVPVGIWLILGGSNAIKDKKIKKFINCNVPIIFVLIIGFIMLPMMIGSEGASAGMEIKREALVEFVIARHYLYPIVYLFYSNLTDLIVIIIFGSTLLIVLLAVKKVGIEYFVLTSMSVMSILTSAIMRLAMSSMFDSYKTTYPDRYYYGSNILYLIIVLYGLVRLIERKKQVVSLLMAVVMSALLINGELFPKMGISNKYLTGSNENIQWVDCLSKAYFENTVNNGIYYVDNQPIWCPAIQMPIQYVWDSMQ